MNIALDGMPLLSPLTGVGHYTAELARHLAIVAHVAAHLYVSLGAEQHADNAEAERVMHLIMNLIERDLEKPEHQ